MLTPKDPLEVDHALLQRHVIGHLERHGPDAIAAEDPVLRGLQWNDDLLVGVVPAALRSLGPQHADDLERDAANAERLADHGPGVLAQLLGHFRTQQHIPLARLVVAVAERAPVLHGVVQHLEEIGGGAKDLGIEVLATVGDLLIGCQLRHHFLDEPGLALDREVVVGGEVDPVALRHAAPEGLPGVDGEGVGAERGNLVLDRLLGATAESHHGDHRTHADDDAKHRQGGAELVGADGLERHRDSFA